MVKAKKFTLVKHFEGEPKQSNFKLVDEDLPEIKEDGWFFHFKRISLAANFVNFNRNPCGSTFPKCRPVHATVCCKTFARR